MKYADYIQFCKTTESVPNAVTVDYHRLEAAVKLVTTANKLLDLLKKNIFYGKAVDEAKWLNGLRVINETMTEAMEQQYRRMKHPQDRDQQLNFDVRLAHAIIGMSTETGEILEAFEEAVFKGGEFDVVNFGEELGDVQWYTAIGVDAGNLDFDNILETNRNKLQARYSSGSFSNEEANERDLTTERSILEDGISEAASLDDNVTPQTDEDVDPVDVVEPTVDAETLDTVSNSTSTKPRRKKASS